MAVYTWPPLMPSPRRLLTLGRFELREPDDAAADGALIPVQPKRLALLVYLAESARRGFVRRDALLGLFWPELSDDEARRALRQALHQLRKAAGVDAIVARADDQVGVTPDALWLDAAEVERAAAAGDDARVLALAHAYERQSRRFVPPKRPA